MSPEDQSSAPQTCPVGMSDLKPCGRPTHHAPQGVDDEPVCLMHSLDPDKDKLKFREEIDAILNATSSYHRPTDRFDFEKFVFPEADFGGTTFTRDADFRRAKFTEAADFRGRSLPKALTSLLRRSPRVLTSLPRRSPRVLTSLPRRSPKRLASVGRRSPKRLTSVGRRSPKRLTSVGQDLSSRREYTLSG